MNKRFREVRNDTGLTQEAFGEKIGKNRGQIRDIEIGKTKVTPEIALTLERLFNISKNWLLFGKGFKHNNALSETTDESAIAAQGVIDVPCLTVRASAGRGAHIFTLNNFLTKGVIKLDVTFFKTKPSKRLFAIQVDGYSMVPTLLPDSWVIFNREPDYDGEGLYVIRWGDELLVKLLQKERNGDLDIISVNKEYKSWQLGADDQEGFGIIGKIVKVII